MAEKTACPVSLQTFLAENKGVDFDRLGEDVDLSPRAFSTGSFGFYGTGKTRVKVGDQMVKAQVSLSVTIIGSKDAPRENPPVENEPAPAPATEPAAEEPADQKKTGKKRAA